MSVNLIRSQIKSIDVQSIKRIDLSNINPPTESVDAIEVAESKDSFELSGNKEAEKKNQKPWNKFFMGNWRL